MMVQPPKSGSTRRYVLRYITPVRYDNVKPAVMLLQCPDGGEDNMDRSGDDLYNVARTARAPRLPRWPQSLAPSVIALPQAATAEPPLKSSMPPINSRV